MIGKMKALEKRVEELEKSKETYLNNISSLAAEMTQLRHAIQDVGRNDDKYRKEFMNEDGLLDYQNYKKSRADKDGEK